MSHATWGHIMSIIQFVYGTFTLFGLSSQIIPLPIFQHRRFRSSARYAPLPIYSNGFGLLHYIFLGSSPFARHYSENLSRFLFLQVLRCFTSLGSPPVLNRLFWVAPFGYLRIFNRLHLPVAFRSLPRPSSPPVA